MLERKATTAQGSIAEIAYSFKLARSLRLYELERGTE